MCIGAMFRSIAMSIMSWSRTRDIGIPLRLSHPRMKGHSVAPRDGILTACRYSTISLWQYVLIHQTAYEMNFSPLAGSNIFAARIIPIVAVETMSS